MVVLYDLIFVVFAILYVPYLVIRRKWHPQFRMRLGRIPRYLVQRFRDQPQIWVHAVSVGEVMTVVGLVQALKRRYPHHGIVLSTVTTTGYEVARAQLAPEDAVIFAPLDFSPIVRHLVRVIRPVLYVTAETEIWPNIFYALHRRFVPIVMVNGRLSDKGFRRYHLGRWFIYRVLQYVRFFCMQSELDAERVTALGASPAKVAVTGNMKFDQAGHGAAHKVDAVVGSWTGPVWIAGSTHPGEEAIVLHVFKQLRLEFPLLKLIVVPRHVERVDEVAAIIRQEGLECQRYTELENGGALTGRILLVDVIGRLKGLYAVASVVFVGKSLCGRGGQNMIEPAFFGKPVIVGPQTQNFKSIIELLIRRQAVSVVRNPQELRDVLKDLLRDPVKAGAMGARAREVVMDQQGATVRTLEIITNILPE